MNKILGYIGKGPAGIVGALILFLALVSLITQSPATGAKAGYDVMHFRLVSTGIVVSDGDNVGPELKEGQVLGYKACGDKPASSAKA